MNIERLLFEDYFLKNRSLSWPIYTTKTIWDIWVQELRAEFDKVLAHMYAYKIEFKMKF